MKIIKIEVCDQCPVIEIFGNYCSCGHLKVKWKTPYSEQRKVEPKNNPPSFCPLEEV